MKKSTSSKKGGCCSVKIFLWLFLWPIMLIAWVIQTNRLSNKAKIIIGAIFGGFYLIVIASILFSDTPAESSGKFDEPSSSLSSMVSLLEETESKEEASKVESKKESSSKESSAPESSSSVSSKEETAPVSSSSVSSSQMSSEAVSEPPAEPSSSEAPPASSEPEVSSEPESSEPAAEPSVPEDTSPIVYITPTGKRYHYSADCAGKNAIETTLDRASSSHGPCGTCVY